MGTLLRRYENFVQGVCHDLYGRTDGRHVVRWHLVLAEETGHAGTYGWKNETSAVLQGG